MKGFASYASITTDAHMYKRSIKPIADFLMIPPHMGYISLTRNSARSIMSAVRWLLSSAHGSTPMPPIM